jgi:hypothetical protein
MFIKKPLITLLEFLIYYLQIYKNTYWPGTAQTDRSKRHLVFFLFTKRNASSYDICHFFM